MPISTFLRLTLAAYALALLPQAATAQTATSSGNDRRPTRAHGYIGLGVALPSLNGGTELKRAQQLRDAGLSYYATSDGSRAAIGNSPSLVGQSIEFAYYRPIRSVPGLFWGTSVHASLTGSEPSEGDYDEGYFFNFLQAGLAAKYYPFASNRLFAELDGGMATVWTKNRYRGAGGAQEFEHQFGIGFGGRAALGYSFVLSEALNLGIDVKAAYQLNQARVEVNGIGDDNWRYGAFQLMAGFTF